MYLETGGIINRRVSKRQSSDGSGIVSRCSTTTAMGAEAALPAFIYIGLQRRNGGLSRGVG